jgi:hypothetical protein
MQCLSRHDTHAQPCSHCLWLEQALQASEQAGINRQQSRQELYVRKFLKNPKGHSVFDKKLSQQVHHCR